MGSLQKIWLLCIMELTSNMKNKLKNSFFVIYRVTRDQYVNTEEFIDKVAENLRGKLAKANL